MRQHELAFERGRPVLMGIVNAGPDSFSDPGPRELDGLLRTAHGLIEAGASLIDVGGESGRTDRDAVSEDEEAARIVPLSDGDMQLTFSDVPYGSWAPWLAGIERELGARATSVTVNARDKTPGNVDVELALRLARK